MGFARLSVRLRSHKHEYESGTVWVPVPCIQVLANMSLHIYFNGGCSHTYEYGLPVNFTRTSSSSSSVDGQTSTC